MGKHLHSRRKGITKKAAERIVHKRKLGFLIKLMGDLKRYVRASVRRYVGSDQGYWKCFLRGEGTLVIWVIIMDRRCEVVVDSGACFRECVGRGQSSTFVTVFANQCLLLQNKTLFT